MPNSALDQPNGFKYANYVAGQKAVLELLGIKTAKEKPGKDKGWGAADYALGAGAAALGGAGAYKYMRRFKPSGDATLRALQEQSKDLPFEVASHMPTDSVKGRLIRRILYGAPDISDAVAEAGRAGQTLKRDATVLHHGSPFAQLPVEGKVNLNAPNQGLAPALADKGGFGKLFSQVQEQLPEGTTAIPATSSMDAVLAHFKHPEPMSQHLKDALPGGWLIKPTDESLGDVNSFINEATPFTDKRWQNVMKNPGGFVLQEKVPMTNEYRVHSVQGVPFTATHRRMPEGKGRDLWNKVTGAMGGGAGGMAHIPVTGDKRQALMDYVSTVNKPLQAAYGDAPMHQAFDVAELGDGGFRLLESNPTPGTFNNPMTSRALQEQVTGRMHQDKAGLGALVAGLGLGAGTGEASSHLRNRDNR